LGHFTHYRDSVFTVFLSSHTQLLKQAKVVSLQIPTHAILDHIRTSLDAT